MGDRGTRRTNQEKLVARGCRTPRGRGPTRVRGRGPYRGRHPYLDHACRDLGHVHNLVRTPACLSARRSAQEPLLRKQISCFAFVCLFSQWLERWLLKRVLCAKSTAVELEIGGCTDLINTCF